MRGSALLARPCARRRAAVEVLTRRARLCSDRAVPYSAHAVLAARAAVAASTVCRHAAQALGGVALAREAGAAVALHTAPCVSATSSTASRVLHIASHAAALVHRLTAREEFVLRATVELSHSTIPFYTYRGVAPGAPRAVPRVRI